MRLHGEEPESAAKLRFLPALFSGFYELLRLNLCFLAGCLLVLTIPASLAALYSQVLLMMDPQLVYPDTGFWQCLKKKWKKALVLGLITGGALGFAGFSCWLYAAVFSEISPVFYVLSGIALCLFLGVSCIGNAAFAMLSVTEAPVGVLLKDALSLSARYPGHVLGGAAAGLVLLAACIALFPGSILFVAFIVFSLMVFISAWLMRAELEQYCQQRGGHAAEGDLEPADVPEDVSTFQTRRNKT